MITLAQINEVARKQREARDRAMQGWTEIRCGDARMTVDRYAPDASYTVALDYVQREHARLQAKKHEIPYARTHAWNQYDQTCTVCLRTALDVHQWQLRCEEPKMIRYPNPPFTNKDRDTWPTVTEHATEMIQNRPNFGPETDEPKFIVKIVRVVRRKAAPVVVEDVK